MTSDDIRMMPVTLTNVGLEVKTEQIRRRTHSRIPQVLGTTYVEKKWPLRGIDVTAQPGEVLGVFDATASRESLVLRLMSGLLQPDEGAVQHLARAVLITNPRSKDVKSLSIRQTIHILSGLMGLTDTEIRQKFDQIARAAGVSNMLNAQATEADAAIIRQIAFSAGTRMPTHQFAFDRSLPVGKPEFKERCERRVNKLRSHGAVLIAHIPQLAHMRTYVDRGLFLDGEESAVLPKAEFIREVTKALEQQREDRRDGRRNS